ncbi:MAG: hypothetical protein AAF206_15725 [Bacteroidota bacterium]
MKGAGGIFYTMQRLTNWLVQLWLHNRTRRHDVLDRARPAPPDTCPEPGCNYAT